jgi:hypothetical protein
MESVTECNTGVRKKSLRVNYALAATLLASGMTYEEIAPKVGSASGESLRAGLSRKGVTLKHVRNLPIRDERVTSVTARVAAVAADVLRDRLNGQIHSQIGLLEAEPATRYGELASKGQGRAAVVKTIAESFKALNGGAETQVTVFGVNVIRDGDPLSGAQDITPSEPGTSETNSGE